MKIGIWIRSTSFKGAKSPLAIVQKFSGSQRKKQRTKPTKTKKQALSALVTIQFVAMESIGFHVSIFLRHVNNHEERY